MHNSLLHLSPHTKNHTNTAQVDWNKVASLIGYGSAKSASTRFGIIRKRRGCTKPNKPAHVGVYARNVTKTGTPAKGAASRASRAKPAASTKKGVNRRGSVGGKGKKLPQKVQDDDDNVESGQDEKAKDLVAPSNDEQQDIEYDAPEGEKPVRDLMAPSDEEEEEQEQESFQSQVSRGLYAESNAEEDEGNLSDDTLELLNRQIAQQQEAQLQAQMQQRMGQQGVNEEYDAYEPGAIYQNSQDEGQYYEHMAQGVPTYYN